MIKRYTNRRYFIISLLYFQVIKHFSQRRPTCYSSKLFIALWLQAHDANYITLQPILLQLWPRCCGFWCGNSDYPTQTDFLYIRNSRICTVDLIQHVWLCSSNLKTVCIWLWPLTLRAILLRPGRGAEYCDQFVCLSVCLCVSVREHIYGTAGLIFTKFVMLIQRGRGSVLLWRRCDMLCTSGFYGSRHVWP